MSKSAISTFVSTLNFDVETKEDAMNLFTTIASHDSLNACDLLWIGVDANEQDAEGNPAYLSWDEGELTKYAKFLTAFISVGSTPFPHKLVKNKQVVIVDSFTSYDQLTAMKEAGVNLSYAVWNRKERMLKGVANDALELPAYEGDGDPRKEIYLTNSSKCDFAQPLGWLNLCHLANILEKLSNSKKAEFVSYFNHLTKEGGKRDTTATMQTFASVVGRKAELKFDFANQVISGSRDYVVRSKGFIPEYGTISAQTLMGLLAIQLAGVNFSSSAGVGQSMVDGIIAGVTQLWEEEDTYGALMDEHQQLRVVRENSLAILKVNFYRRDYPYFSLANNNNMQGVSAACSWLANHQKQFWVDKNAMKRVVVGAGVTAMYAYLNYTTNRVITILDVKKPGKLLNRGWNAIAISPSEGIPGTVGYRPYVNAALQQLHHHEDGTTEIINVRGDRHLMLTHDGNFITNGSGVGYSFVPHAFTVPVKLRSSYDAVSFKEGETLESIQAELEAELNKVLDEGRTILPGTKETTILKFRGRNLVTYRGINRSISLSRKHGASFKVKALVTSKSLSIEVTVIYFVEGDYAIKARGLGIKAMLKRAGDVCVFDESGKQIEISSALNSECLKGNAARMAQYAEAMQDETGNQCQLDLKHEALHTPYGVQDLNDHESHFMMWWHENTKTYFITDWMESDYFQTILLARAGMEECKGESGAVEEALAHEANSRVSLMNFKDGAPVTWAEVQDDAYVYVSEEVQGVLAPYVVQVELTSIRESSVEAQSPTLQQICSVYAAKPELGLSLLEDAADTENAVMGIGAMALSDAGLLDIENFSGLTLEGKEQEEKLAASLQLTPKLVAEQLNPSWFSLGGAQLYAPNKDPYLAFVDPAAPKKFKPSVLINRVGINEDAGQGFSLFSVIQGTASNYLINVGSGYNLSSVLVCEAALARYALLKATQPEQKKKAMERLKLAVKANNSGWITVYEDAYLAGLNDNGTKLGEILHEYRKGFVEADKTQSGKKYDQCIEEIRKVLSEIAGTTIETVVAEKILWAYRVARGISALERSSKLSYVRYNLNLTEEELDMVAIAGAFRRCDQGRFGNFISEVDDSEEGFGQSVWSLLWDRWEVLEGNDGEDLPGLQYQLPYFLRRKIFKAMILQLDIAKMKKSVAAITGKSLTTKKDPRVKAHAVGFSTLPKLVATDETVDDDLIPQIPLEYASVDEKKTEEVEDPFGTYLNLGGKDEFYSFGEIGGAFEHLYRYCPLTADGKADFSRDPDKTFHVKQSVDGWQFDDVLYFWVDTLPVRTIFERAALRYPNGCFIYSDDKGAGEIGVFIHFQSLLKASAFFSGGTSTGVALKLAELMIAMSGPYKKRPKNWETRARNSLISIRSQFEELLKAGLMRRIGRTKPSAQGAKVLTSHSCGYQNVEYEGEVYRLPMVRMNPNDDLVKVGKYNRGDIVAVFRTPQIAKLYAVMVLDDSVTIGHIEVNALLWAKTNRGDGDGDPIAIENLSQRMRDRAKAQA